MATFLSLVEEPFREMLLKFRAFLPGFLAMLVILALGLAASWALRRLVVALLDLARFDRWCDRMGFTALLRREQLWARPALAAGAVAYWGSLMFFVMTALSALRLDAVRLLVAQSFLYLPRVLSALVLVFFGYLLTGFASRAALIAAVNAGSRHARLLAAGVRLLLTVLILAMSLEQLQVAPSIVLAAFSIAFGGIVLALAIAFGVAGIEPARRFFRDDAEPPPPAAGGVDHL